MRRMVEPGLSAGRSERKSRLSGGFFLLATPGGNGAVPIQAR